jgi:Glycosyl hydrolase family 63 C-terminal domain
MNAERQRLQESDERRINWKRWGPYLAERAWGTVREDYSADGSAWRYFPHDHARSRAYRWNEDGIAGICDRHQHICFAIALWNERDPILKERLFGVTGPQGNHGEDVKEYYYYLDNTPTHSYMKCAYKYPQSEYPYNQLVEENARRGREKPEYELFDTAVFDDERYFDLVVEYAKADAETVLARITVHNRGPQPAPIHVLPTIWFRNRWSWTVGSTRPSLMRADPPAGTSLVVLDEATYGRRYLYVDGAPDLLFTENDTNTARLFGTPNGSPFVKDAFDRFVVHGERTAVNPTQTGTKAAAHLSTTIPSGGSVVYRLRFANRETPAPFDSDFAQTFADRIREADEFYAGVIPTSLSDDGKRVMRQACAGLLWSKQFYHYVVKEWLHGDPAQPAPPPERASGRNSDWRHVYNADVLSMPDKWEYPWYASWDLAFHCIPFALIDPAFAKDQLILLLREWYLHPNGQIPAYEWSFGDVNPPVHAWAAWRVYKIDQKRTGRADLRFLERIFHKLLLNFTWWVNRKDPEGSNLFEGGFLGLDNIGVFDRSRPLPLAGHIEQSDGTSWMAMYTLNLLAMAMELASTDPAYEDIASKFWEHFLHIANAMSNRGDATLCLWDDADGFYYDVLHTADGARVPLKVRSMVGLVPLFAVETIEPRLLARLTAFRRRMNWFLENRPDLTRNVASMEEPGRGARLLMSVVDRGQLESILRVMLDEAEFLSPYGIRALSRVHKDHPYMLRIDGADHLVDYEPGESTNALFGGNSNWRGPIWVPVNYLLIESLQKYHYYYGDGFKVECPTGSGQMMTLWEVAAEISRRLSLLFLRGSDGRRPVFGSNETFQQSEHWRDLVPFHEYFHGDTGAGLGASHQTGWTAIVAKLLQQSGEHPRRRGRPPT